MKHKFVFFILLSFTFTQKVLAQEKATSKLALQIGYYGETISHTGLTAGIEYIPVSAEKYQMVLSSNLGGYVHIRNNVSIFVRGQWGQRYVFSNGIFVEQFLGLGYLRHFSHGGPTYEVLPNGAVIKNSNFGRGMIMPSVGLGAGYDFSLKSEKNLKIYLRPELFWKAPFNGYYLTHFALNTGIVFSI